MLSIIIPTFNQVEYTKDCIAGLRRNTLPGTYEIIVVDNGSIDQTAKYCRADPELARNFIALDRNYGFSRACNEGARKAKGETLVFLNNDTIPLAGWLEPLLEMLAQPKVGLVGPKLVYPTTNTINSAGYVRSRLANSFYALYHDLPVTIPGVNKVREFQALLGACIAIGKELFSAVGEFSDFGIEDVDLALKVRKAGRAVVYVPSSVVLHHGSVTILGTPTHELPPNTDTEFRKNWGDIFLNDDVRYYAEDGFQIEWLTPQHYILLRSDNPVYELYGRACFAFEQGETLQARELLDQAIKTDPTFKNAIAMRGQIALAESQLDLAVSLYQRVLDLDPDHLNAYLVLGKIGLLEKNPERAQIFFDQLRRPNTPHTLLKEIM